MVATFASSAEFAIPALFGAGPGCCVTGPVSTYTFTDPGDGLMNLRIDNRWVGADRKKPVRTDRSGDAELIRRSLDSRPQMIVSFRRGSAGRSARVRDARDQAIRIELDVYLTRQISVSHPLLEPSPPQRHYRW